MFSSKARLELYGKTPMQVSAVLDSGAVEAYAQANGTSVAQLRAAAEALPEVAELKSARARREAVDAILAEEIASNSGTFAKNQPVQQAIDTYNGIKRTSGEDFRALLRQTLGDNAAGFLKDETGIAGMETTGYNGDVATGGKEDDTSYSWEDANKGILLLSAKAHGKENWKSNPNKKRGSEKHQKSGDRERNVGHPNGEEHSRVPKGSGGRAKGSNGPLRADTLDEIGQAILGGVAAAGTGYLIYRGIRLLPSLLPALWWTIPANLATP